MMIHNCVNATVYSAVDEGFTPIVVEEAVNTMDQKLHDKVVKAPQIKDAFLAGIQFGYSKVYKLEDVLNNNFTYEKFT
jgi:nicotinamidase-related amidase